MSITTVQPSTNSTVATSAANTLHAAASTNQLSYNDFLTLLMAELKNQDPTQPMDATQTVAQLATVSEVGQSVQANKTLSSLLTATSLAQAPMLVGQTITSADGSTTGTVALTLGVASAASLIATIFRFCGAMPNSMQHRTLCHG